ncbi:MAG TPA: DUF4412 domain-containing protein [Bacteroidota bacterium]|nr:DUF4412 domain-containing protein [Bacteroidota bacterium]
MPCLSKSAVALVLFFIATTFTLAQGLYWENTTVMPMSGRERHAKNYYMPKMLKVVSDDRDDYTIIRLDKQEFVTVNDKDKTYSETSFSDMEDAVKKATGKMNEQLAAIQERLKSMPEDQRKMMEGMIGKTMSLTSADSTFQVVPGSEKKTISGFSCSQYLLKQGDKDLITFWTTTDLKGYKEMGDDMKEFGAKLASLNPRNGSALANGSRKIEGFPIETDMGGFTMTVTKAETRSTPSAEFDVPTDYKKIDSPLIERLNSMDRRGRQRPGGDNN